MASNFFRYKTEGSALDGQMMTTTNSMDHRIGARAREQVALGRIRCTKLKTKRFNMFIVAMVLPYVT